MLFAKFSPTQDYYVMLKGCQFTSPEPVKQQITPQKG